MYIIGNENDAYIGPRLQQIACSGAIYAMERTVSEISIVMKTALTSTWGALPPRLVHYLSNDRFYCSVTSNCTHRTMHDACLCVCK